MFARRKREGVFAMTEPDFEAKFLPILEEAPALSSLPSCLENVYTVSKIYKGAFDGKFCYDEKM